MSARGSSTGSLLGLWLLMFVIIKVGGTSLAEWSWWWLLLPNRARPRAHPAQARVAVTTVLIALIAFAAGLFIGRKNEERKFWQAMAQIEGERARAYVEELEKNV